jgi:hypothetical protein
MKLFSVHSIYLMIPMYKNKHMYKFKRVIRHIQLISMNRRFFWKHL